VPVVPIGIWGTEQVWPRSAKVPNLTNVLHPPIVTVRVGRPVELAYDDVAADTERMMEAIVRLLPPEARRARDPSPEEIARATPSGQVRDDESDHEAERRPGTD
jgi:putative phosphoserine phosphatase/1-acylglycerol-3-phosphate O-acyltransferase